MLTRRTVVDGLVTTILTTTQPIRAFTQTSARSTSGPLVLAASFGAIGDGRTDATAALTRALSSGSVIDGRNGTFAISGSIRVGRNFKGLVNATLIQTGPRSNGGRALEVENANDFVIENVTLQLAQGDEPGDQTLILKVGGLFLQRCSDFTLRRLHVSRGGIGSAVAIFDSARFEADDLQISDLSYHLAQHPTDDAIHGIVFVRCSTFKLRDTIVSNISGSDGRTELYDFNRGVAATGCAHFEIARLKLCNVGQGLDLTGSFGNRDFRVYDSIAEDCASWGFKFANSAQDGVVDRCRTARTGFGGFVVSGPSERDIPQTQRICISRCTAEEVIGGQKFRASFGFGILTTQAIDPTYPRSILFKECVARTRTSGHLMAFGFRNEVLSVPTDGVVNRVFNCHVEGFSQAAFKGF